MSCIGRFFNLFRRNSIDRDIREELASHIEEAVEHGRSIDEATRAFGNQLLQRERVRDVKLLGWLDALRADVVFGWRQLRKRPAVSAAAVLSLALAIGATTAAYRLIDAVLLRTLPVSHPERLFYLATTSFDREGHSEVRADFDYPTFRQYRSLVADRADLMVVGTADTRQEVVFKPGVESERISMQYLSGNVFNVFELRPAIGRLLASSDDLKPGASPVAVLSYEFWTRRFNRNPEVLGQTFRMGDDQFEIVGVVSKGFTGTEPGALTDIFLPAMMNTQAIDSPGWSWFWLWLRPKPGVTPEQVRQPLQSIFTHDLKDRLKQFDSGTSEAAKQAYMSQKLTLLSAASGASDVQHTYRLPLIILAGLVVLVLLIACMNVGNLMAAQATARAREMALRVSIGAGRWRLMQMILVESALLALIASLVGSFFATWSAPLVISMLHVPEDPVRLVLDSGWRSVGFGVVLASLVVLLFGFAPALQSSAVKPIHALKGDSVRHSRRLMFGLLAAQMAFCVLVQFVAGLFVSTFERLSSKPLGFSAGNVLIVECGVSKEQPPHFWMQVADQLRNVPGVQNVALAGWPLLSRNRWTESVRIPGHDIVDASAYALDVSPGFFQAMQISRMDGRDFRAADQPPYLNKTGQPVPGVGIVNHAFVQRFFPRQNPVGKSFGVFKGKDTVASVEVVGYVADAAYYDVRDPMPPTIYFPQIGRQTNTLVVRTKDNPLALASTLRTALSKANSDIKVHDMQEQSGFVRWQMLRERLLASLSLFFSLVALVLAAIGLYGLLNYSVTEQRHEIGIRMALGARPAQVVQLVTSNLFLMVSLGMLVGLGGGILCGRFLQSLLFEIKPSDPGAVIVPLLALLVVGFGSSLPPALRAIKTDPAQTLRSE